VAQTEISNAGITSQIFVTPAALGFWFGSVLSIVAIGSYPFLKEAFPLEGSLVLILLLISGLAFALIVPDLFTRQFSDTAWCWIGAAVFVIGYYFKSLYFAFSPAPWRIDTELYWLDESIIVEGLLYTTIAFVAFIVTSKLVFFSKGIEREGRLEKGVLPKAQGRVSATVIVSGCAAFVALTVVLLWLKVWLGIAAMGEGTVHLPYRIDTVINRVLNDLVPGVLLLLIWLAERDTQGMTQVFTVTCMLLTQIACAFVSTSRGTLIFTGVSLFVLWKLSGTLGKRRKALLVTILVVGIAAIPVLSILRLEQMAFHNRDFGVASVWLATGIGQDDFAKAISKPLERVTGADGLWHMLGFIRAHGFEDGLRWEAFVQRGITQFFTRNVVGVEVDGDFRAPGLVATFLFAGGGWGLPVLIGLYTVMMAATWSFVARRRGAVGCAILALVMTTFTMEGNLYVQNLVSAVATIEVCYIAATALSARAIQTNLVFRHGG
jgi:hypothetical protein